MNPARFAQDAPAGQWTEVEAGLPGGGRAWNEVWALVCICPRGSRGGFPPLLLAPLCPRIVPAARQGARRRQRMGGDQTPARRSFRTGSEATLFDTRPSTLDTGCPKRTHAAGPA